ncbi:MAG: methyl-accepting chemotaxis protein [Rhodocyclaceae bacterium]|nr:methyl-accepting chemotaxis protein [Rhodocyclaceae bacterium]
MLKGVFRPATALMSCMRYTYKFALLGALALVAMGYLLWHLYDGLNHTIEAAAAKLDGVALVERSARIVQGVQQHRGLSSGVLSGDASLRDRRAAKEKEIGEALQAFAGRLPPSLAGDEAWRRIVGDWERLRGGVLQLSAADSFARHTQLIDQLLIFQIAAADATSLTFDPEVDVFYLVDTGLTRLPVVLERLGQLRALGTGHLAVRQIGDAQKVRLHSLIAEMNGALKFLHLNLDKTGRYNAGLAGSLKQTRERIGSDSEAVVRLIVDDIVGGVFATAPADYFALTTRLIDLGYQEAYDVLLPTLRALIEARAERARHLLQVVLGVAAAMLAAIGYLSVGAYFSTVDNVAALAASARRIAGGDLTVRIDLATRDEHRLVADSFNEIATAFSRLLKNVQGGAHQVLETARSIAESSTRIAGSSSQQSESAAAMAASVEEMSNGVEHISENARSAHGVTSEAGDLSAHGGRIVGTVVGGIEKIADAVNRSAATIENLGRHSDRISAIVGVIKEIADQTNLLALNAAIEAARAGESGRGFAVVADEVRKLAERTAKSTQEITEMIGAIQHGTRDAVASMQDGVDRVAEGVELAHRAGDAMQRIEEGARQAVAMVSDISAALHEQSAAGTQISQNVEVIARMAEENSSAVARNAATTGRLEELAAMLEAEVKPYRIA